MDDTTKLIIGVSIIFAICFIKMMFHIVSLESKIDDLYLTIRIMRSEINERLKNT